MEQATDMIERRAAEIDPFAFSAAAKELYKGDDRSLLTGYQNQARRQAEQEMSQRV